MQYIRFSTLYASTAAEKAQDMAGVGVTMAAWEYCAKWYGEDKEAAKTRASGLEGDGNRNCKSSSAN